MAVVAKRLELRLLLQRYTKVVLGRTEGVLQGPKRVARWAGWGLGAALAVTAGCRKAAPAGSVITVGAQQEPDSMFLPFREMIAADEVLRAGAMTLTVFNDRWELVPHAATAIPTLANGGVQRLPDGRMVTTWNIRKDLCWPDETPLTADDFALAFRVWKDPVQEIADRTFVEHMESVEAQGADHRTLRITWKDPYAYHAGYRNLEALPAHVLKTAAAGGVSLKDHAFGIKPLLAGPFTVLNWERGQYITLERNPCPARSSNNGVRRLVWRFIPQTTSLEAALLAGTLDAISPVGLHVDQVLELQRRHADRFDFHFKEALQWEHITLNLNDPWLADARMRRALLMGLDRQAMVKRLFAGKQPVAHGLVPSGHPDAAPNLPQVTHDPVGARALIEEMGFVRGKDGIYVKAGERLRLVMQTTAGIATRERVEQVLQDQWRDIGVELLVDNVPARVLFGDVLRHRKFKHMVMFAWAQDPLRISDAQSRCDMIPSAENGWLGQNYGGWCDHESTALFKQANTELDVDKRRALLWRIQQRWTQQLPALPLYFRAESSVTRKGFVGWKPTGTLTPVTWNVQEWRLP